MSPEEARVALAHAVEHLVAQTGDPETMLAQMRAFAQEAAPVIESLAPNDPAAPLYRKLLELLGQLGDPEHGEESLAELGPLMAQLGQLQSGAVDPAKAAARLEELRASAGAGTITPEQRVELAQLAKQQAVAALSTEDLDACRARLEEAASQLRTALGERAGLKQALAELLDVLAAQRELLSSDSDFEGVLKNMEESIAVSRQMVADPDPGFAEVMQRSFASALQGGAVLAKTLGHPDLAREHLVEARALLSALVAADPSQADRAQELADVEASLAKLPAPAAAPSPTPAAAPSPALVLEVQEPGQQPRRLELTGLVLRVGTDDRSAVKLAAPGVGRMHALIELLPDAVVLTDLGSAPTRVNGEVVLHANLRAGDVLQLGEATVKVISVPG